MVRAPHPLSSAEGRMVGMTVGRYRILAKIGQGGMGTVWKAQDTLLGRTVALKFLPDAFADSPKARRRFQHEARAASALDHPSVATVYDFGEVDGRLYIAGSYVCGETISDRASRKPLAIDEALRVAIEAAEALGHAHAHGVIHRDVSGRNIMVSESGRVVVLDFGLATGAGGSRITPSGDLIGTVAYLAPEVALGGRSDGRADLYGLGVVLYEMLTGSTPYQNDRVAALIYNIVHGTPEPPSVKRPEVTPQLDRIVLKALAKEPSQRYQSAAELVADLRHVVQPSEGHTTSEASVPLLRRAYLAVLPFRDLDAPDGHDKGPLFAGGLAEIVSASLARCDDIHVIPPSAVPERQGVDAGLKRLALDVGADLLLSATVQRSRDRIRIAYSVLDARTIVQLHGGTIDGRMAHLMDVEDRLVGRVIESLGLQGWIEEYSGTLGPRDPKARERYLLALGCLQRHENEASVDRAIELLEELRAIDGESALTMAGLGRAYLAKYRLTHLESWEKRAAAACDRALVLAPEAPDVQMTYGHLQTETGRYGAALKNYQKSLKLRPSDAEALIGMSRAYEATGDLIKAEQVLRDAIAVRAEDWRSYSQLGVYYFNRGRYQQAADLWRRVVEMMPDNIRGHNNLAAAHVHMGQYPEATTAYRRSLDIQPSATAYTGLGTVHYFLGAYAEAATMFERGAALRPKDPVQWGNLADAYCWMPGNDQRAASAYDQAIALMRAELRVNPKKGFAWAKLAEWLAKHSQAREAVQCIRRATRLAPADVNCMVAAVIVYHLAGDRGEALKWIERAVKAGFDPAGLERDPELASLRRDPAYPRTIQEARAT